MLVNEEKAEEEAWRDPLEQYLPGLSINVVENFV